MLRACQFPPVASPALSALRLSLLPVLALTSPSNFRTYSSLNFPPVLIRRLQLSNSLYFGPSTFNSAAPTMAARPFLRRRVSFATSSSSGGGYGREILVQHLLVKADDPTLLVELQKRAVGGEDLSDLALEYSTCPSKEKGGMLGWVRKGQMVPEFEEAAFSAPLNKIVRCKTKFGWHLLQVLSEREELSLQDIQPDELHAKLQDSTFLEEAQLIDVREPDEVAQASLPNFEVFPLRQFGTWAPEITTKFDPDKETYVMCHHGMRSLQVAKWLQSQRKNRIPSLHPPKSGKNISTTFEN
ncbi:hypothetical protein V2J09_006187 [Rumex salicifolius]